ncbi:flagellar hook-associated protein FlgL [Thiohalobacter thiocyanaticus]|uniref:Flagellar hook-associated protein 3 n=1 Tax=Thiohalobacter thiocyanaticus TaxID=585455 RepID=A0A426QGQ7_9GAMM|nr:flagellar hook-associated protein FlgL [Thiohalobacter thiocyanaticus]RRQ20934.1 flagellar hook-associated protein 3 [Thiohalobacter thiocyanaticus]
MRISTSQLYQQGLNAIQDQQTQLARVSNQLGTGRRIVSPADDPAASAAIVGLNEDLQRLERFQTNADRAESRLGLTETTLDSGISALQRLRELTITGLNGSQSAQSRADIAAEGRQLLDQMLALANTRDANGEYIFGGFQSQSEPFSQTAGVVSYSGDQGQRFIAVSENRQIAVTDSGSDIFMAAPADSNESVFTVMSDFITAMENNQPQDLDSPPRTAHILDDIDAVIDNMSAARSSIGARQRALDLQRNQNADAILRMEQTRSGLQDLDYAEAATNLNRHTAALEAAQLSFSRIQNLSLFNFLR